LATAAETIAIWIGVARTSNWPMADIAVCAASGSSGKMLGVTTSGMSRSWPQPNASAWARRASSPISTPRIAKGVLQETWRAYSRVTLWPFPQRSPPGLPSVALLPGSW